MIIYPDEIVKLLDRTVAILKGNCVGDFKVGARSLKNDN